MDKSIKSLIVTYIKKNLKESKQLYFSSNKQDKSNLITAICNSNKAIKNRKVVTNYLREYFNNIDVNTDINNNSSNVNIDVNNDIDTNDSKSVNTDNNIEKRIESIENLINLILTDVEILKQNKVIHPNKIDSDKQDIPKTRFTTYLTESNIEKIQSHSKELNQPITSIVNHIIDFYFLNLNH